MSKKMHIYQKWWLHQAKLLDGSDFLLSQFTFTSLTVLNGSEPDADIGLAKCTNKTEQQWIQDGNVLLWG